MSSEPVDVKLNAQKLSSAASTANLSPLEGLLAELRVRHRGHGSSLAANIGGALESLWSNRLRSLLTMLGIFIGVASVIAALTLTQGLDAYTNNQINNLGTIITVASGSASKFGVSQGARSLSTLTLQDAQSLEGLPHVKNSSPIIMTNDQVVYGSQSLSTQIEGVNTEFPAMTGIQFAQGSWFNQADESSGAKVAILGAMTAAQLFGSTGINPLGQQVRILGQEFRVIGVLALQGGGIVSDNIIYIPLQTAHIRLKNTPTIDQILVQVDTISDVNQATQAITSALRQNHHLSQNRANDFAVQSFIQFIGRGNQANQVLFFLLVAIAAISLTVGGIGIMNIMLVAVTERTWEIGIRMSIGARRRDIRNQFLIEALLLCLFGGVIGLLLGLLVGWALTKNFGVPLVVTPVTLLLPFAVSALLALIFGLYPAIRAARLDPVVAIRIDE